MGPATLKRASSCGLVLVQLLQVELYWDLHMSVDDMVVLP